MIAKLLALAAGAALLSVACFVVLKALGGLPHMPEPWWSAPGPRVTRDLPWTGGARLQINYPAEIAFTEGPQPRFTVSGPKAVVDALTLDAGVLRAPDQPHFAFGRHHDQSLRIEIVSPNTNEFDLAGAQKLDIAAFDQDQLTLICSGAADVHGQGHAKRLNIRSSGASNLDFGSLPVDDAVVSIAGAGDAVVDPHASADVSISGAGHVDLKTRPPVLKSHIAGFGSVTTP